MLRATQLVQLADLVEIRHGYAFGGEFFNEEGVGDVLLTPGNFAIGGGFKGDKFKFYSGPVPQDYVLNEGDLLVTMTDLSKAGDTLGYPALVPRANGPKFLHNQRLGRVIVRNPEELDYTYLYYTLCRDDYRHEVLASATGSTVKHTSPSRIGAFKFELPPIAVQRSIGAALKSLDDKIELNRRMNDTLEAMSRALFRSWFVDFDPVRAKAENRPTGLPADLETLFPSEFEDSPLGEIPKGWKAGSVSDVAGMGRQQVNPGDCPDEVFAHFSIPAFDAGRNPILEVGFAIKSNKLVVTPGSILVSKLNPHIPRVWLTDVDPAYRAVGSTEFFVLQATAPHLSAFLYSLMSSPEFAVDLQTLVTGTSNSHQRVQPEAFMSYTLVVPCNQTATAFEAMVKPLLDQVLANRKEMAQLAKTRDELLPKLLSGVIEVAAEDAHG